MTPRPGVEWTRANVREVLPDLPPPQVTESLCRILGEAETLYLGHFLAPVAELGPIVATFCGRVYFNLSQFRHVCLMSGTPPANLLRAVGHAAEIHPGDELRSRRSLRQAAIALPTMLRILRIQLTLGRRLRATLRWGDERCRFLTSRDVAAESDAQLWDDLMTGMPGATDSVVTVVALAAVSLMEDILRDVVRPTGFDPDELLHATLAAGEKSVSSQQGFEVLDLAHAARADERARNYFLRAGDFSDYRHALSGSDFLRLFDRFLDRYGHRGLYESDWSLPRMRDDPSPVLATIKAHVAAASVPRPAEMIAEQDRAAAATWQSFASSVRGPRRWIVLPLARRLLRRIKRRYLWRELCRSEMMRSMAEQRRLHLEMARRFVERGWLEQPDDYFFLHFDEIAATIASGTDLGCEAETRGTAAVGCVKGLDGRIAEPADPARLKPLVAHRHADREQWAQIEMPLLLHEDDLAQIKSAVSREPSTVDRDPSTLTGLCVSRGLAEGEVIVLREPGEFRLMKRGAILVAPATDPSWTPLFTQAAGVITEVGGMLSHASTVAREYGLPALANVRHATRLLRTGDRIRLDATAGSVTVLARATQG